MDLVLAALPSVRVQPSILFFRWFNTPQPRTGASPVFVATDRVVQGAPKSRNATPKAVTIRECRVTINKILSEPRANQM
jgi:hypothetical protein